MKDYKSLKVGDKIRLVKVPQLDLEQRKRELRNGNKAPGLTADILEKIIRGNPIVTISKIDELGNPWFDFNLTNKKGVREYHSIRIIDNDSWECAA